jgi:voltage-gated potassium channel Kch
MTSSVLIIGHKDKWLIVFVAIVILLSFFLQLSALYYDKTLITSLRFSVIIVFYLLMTYFCLSFTAQDKTISITTLFGSISAYLFIGFIFAYIYLLIALISPNSFTGLNTQYDANAIYFSFITLTTVGYGEIVPLKPIAQNFVWLESFTGQCYLAVLMGQLVGRYVAEHMRES